MAKAKAKDIAVDFDFDMYAEALAEGAKVAERKSKMQQVFLQRSNLSNISCPTGSLWLDLILGGGIPSGRIIGISGPEHKGKSLLATEIAYEQLHAGRFVNMMDAEGGSDPNFLSARGIDFQKYKGEKTKSGVQKKGGRRQQLWLYQPETGEAFRHYMNEQLLKLPEKREKRTPPIIYFLDSVVALISQALDEDLDSNKIAMHAKMYSEILPVINARLARTGASLVYTNQLRKNVGAAFSGFGSAEYEPCGEALKFYSSARIKLGSAKPKLLGKDHPFLNPEFTQAKPRSGGVWEEPHKLGSEFLDRSIYTSMTTIKNKFFNPQKTAWMKITFEEAEATGSGLCRVFDTFSVLNDLGLIERVKERGKPEHYILKANDDVRELENLIPDQFDYFEFKTHVKARGRQLYYDLRDLLLCSGYAYEVKGELGAEEHFESEEDSEQDLNIDPETGEILEH